MSNYRFTTSRLSIYYCLLGCRNFNPNLGLPQTSSSHNNWTHTRLASRIISITVWFIKLTTEYLQMVLIKWRTRYLMLISILLMIIVFCVFRSTLVATFLISISKVPISHFHAVVAPVSPVNEIQLSSNALTYVWCSGKKPRWFEFHNYLSIKSAIHFLHPDNIFFYYDKYPVEDSQHYNTWLEELTGDLSLLSRVLACEDKDKLMCWLWKT